jgi:hypothetical protein
MIRQLTILSFAVMLHISCMRDIDIETVPPDFIIPQASSESPAPGKTGSSVQRRL